MKLLYRHIERIITQLAQQYPVITITGPRQSGKTTLVQKLFPDKEYFNLENPDIREFARSDPRQFLKGKDNGVILDEIQRVPQLLSYLQEIVDSQQTAGRYVLTGSNQFSLLSNITQSLAGRTVLLKLLPFSLLELKGQRDSFQADDWMYYGFYPGVYKENREPSIAYRSYYETYLERDVRQLINIKDIAPFQRFVRLCAGRIGQVFNASHLANETGVSVPTITSWVSILQASYAVMLLQPYYENINKRLVKTPKLYFYDVGLAAYLLGIENQEQLSRDPLRGALFENMVVMELVKMRYNQAKDHHLYFYRDSHQNEVDIVHKRAHRFVTFEVKSAQTFHSDFLKGLKYFSNLFPERVERGFVVYDGHVEQRIQEFEVVNFRRAGEMMQGDG